MTAPRWPGARGGPLALALLVACKGGGATAEEGAAATAPIPVACQAAVAADRSERITLRGVVVAPPDRDALLSSPIAGRLGDIEVREGERVAAGALIAVVEDPSLATAVAEVDAAAGAARAGLDNAERALARAQRLVDQGIAPRRDVEDAQARRAAALAELAGASARRRLAVRRQASARVTAPFAGVVVKVLRRSGELVDGSAATPIARVVDPAVLELRGELPAADLVRLPEGAPVALRVDAVPDLRLTGRILLVAAAVDPLTSLGAVRASIEPPPPGLQLKLGMAGEAVVEVAGREGVVVIPAIAVRRSTEGAEEVVVCAPDGDQVVARVRPIEVGARIADRVEVKRGLAVGDRVVVQHVVGLEDGAALAPGPAAAPAASAGAIPAAAAGAAGPGASVRPPSGTRP